MPRSELVGVLECAGNGRGLYEPSMPGLQWTYGSVGNGRWAETMSFSPTDDTLRLTKALSALLSYPETELFAALPEIRHALDGENMLPRAEQQAVERFLDALGRLDPLDAQERYVALFDRNRSLSLHL